MEWDSVQAHLCGLGSYEGDGDASGARTYLGPHLFVRYIILYSSSLPFPRSRTGSSERGNLPPSPEKGNAMEMRIYCSLIYYFSLSILSHLRITQGEESEIQGGRAWDTGKKGPR